MSRCSAALLLVLVALGAGCRKPAKPGLKVEGSPAGEKVDPHKITSITATSNTSRQIQFALKLLV